MYKDPYVKWLHSFKNEQIHELLSNSNYSRIKLYYIWDELDIFEKTFFIDTLNDLPEPLLYKISKSKSEYLKYLVFKKYSYNTDNKIILEILESIKASQCSLIKYSPLEQHTSFDDQSIESYNFNQWLAIVNGRSVIWLLKNLSFSSQDNFKKILQYFSQTKKFNKNEINKIIHDLRNNLLKDKDQLYNCNFKFLYDLWEFYLNIIQTSPNKDELSQLICAFPTIGDNGTWESSLKSIIDDNLFDKFEKHQFAKLPDDSFIDISLKKIKSLIDLKDEKINDLVNMHRIRLDKLLILSQNFKTEYPTFSVARKFCDRYYISHLNILKKEVKFAYLYDICRMICSNEIVPPIELNQFFIKKQDTLSTYLSLIEHYDDDIERIFKECNLNKTLQGLLKSQLYNSFMGFEDALKKIEDSNFFLEEDDEIDFYSDQYNNEQLLDLKLQFFKKKIEKLDSRLYNIYKINKKIKNKVYKSFVVIIVAAVILFLKFW